MKLYTTASCGAGVSSVSNMQGLVEDVLAQIKVSLYKMLPSFPSIIRRRGVAVIVPKNCRMTTPPFTRMTGGRRREDSSQPS